MRRLIVSVIAVLLLAGGGIYVWTAPPRPLSKTDGAHEAGAVELRLKSVRAFAAGELVIIDANPDGGAARIVSVDADKRSLTLDQPLPFAIEEDKPAVAVRTGAAVLLAEIEPGANMRRFPRVDALTLGKAGQVARRPFLRQIDDWVKVELKPNINAGWARADEVDKVFKGIVDEVTFHRRIPVRSEPYSHEHLILWEGRVVGKSGGPDSNSYILNVRNLSTRDDRAHPVSKSDWDYYSENDYVVFRKEKGLTRIDSPRGFTRRGIPYEASERDGDWLKIYLQTEGRAWVKREQCTFVVEYQYDVPRRSIMGDYLRRLFGSP